MNRYAKFLAAAACAAAVAIPAAWGAEPGVNARELGMLEGILKYCSSVNPEAAVKLQDKVAQLSQGSGDVALAQARKSGEYRMGFDSIADFVNQGNEKDPAKVCAVSPDALK